MDELGRISIHHVEYRIVICTNCQFAVVPSQVSPTIADSSNALPCFSRLYCCIRLLWLEFSCFYYCLNVMSLDMPGAIPNVRPNELDLAVDEAIERPHTRKSLPIDICELRIWIYMALSILIDHYRLRAKATSRDAAWLTYDYSDHKPDWGNQVERTVPSHSVVPSI
jgi:hypothetical protein